MNITQVGILLDLIRKVGTLSSMADFGFFAVHTTRQLFPYRQAVLWRSFGKRFDIAAISGHPTPDPDAPFVQWLNRLLTATPCPDGPLHLSKSSLNPELGQEWDAWLPRHGVLLPMVLANGRGLGGLLLARDDPWTREETLLLMDLSQVYGMVWNQLLTKRGILSRGVDHLSTHGKGWLLFALLLLVMVLPVRQSVLAPAEVVAADPMIIRSPLAGVVDRFMVEPNQEVQAGTPLLALEDAEIRNQLEVAMREYDISVSEFRQAEQKAVRVDEGRNLSAILRQKVQQRLADVRFLQAKLERVVVTAPRDGVAIFSNPEDWIGRPVSMGERLFMLADPAQVEISIQLPVADAITMQPGAKVAMFLNSQPATPFEATVRYAGYQAEVTPEGFLAYPLRAQFKEMTLPPRIGLRGSARIYHGRVTLAEFLGRKPWFHIRSWLGM